MAGRPMKFDRRAAVKLAMHEFWKLGYPNVTVKGLCEKLGIQRSSFYHSFHSLDDLYAEVIEFYMLGAPAVQISKRSEQYSPVEEIRASYKMLCHMRAKDREKKGCLLVNSIGILDALSEAAQKTAITAHRKAASRTKVTLKKAIAAGELPANADLKIIHNGLQTLTMGLNNISKIVTAESDLWNIASTTLDGLGLKAS